jgi:glutamine phosphoribosylpyrophosphate amidotransferase
MCGICGIILRGSDISIPNWMLRSEMTALLISNETRGEDATGIFRAGKNPEIYKSSCNARRFVNQEEYYNFFSESTTYFGHTRKSTTGTPNDCNNNHPLIVGNIIAVHNGTLQSKIPEKEKEKIPGEVDSLFFPWAASKIKSENKIKSLKQLLKSISGSWAFCWYDISTGSTFLTQDNILNRQIYYVINNNYIRFSQIKEDGMELFPDHYIMQCDILGNVTWHRVNVSVPQAILDYLEAIPKNKWSKETVLNMLEEEYNG